MGGDTPASARTPDLSGRWVLNEEQSDDAREKMRGMRRPGGGGSPGGRGPGGMAGGGRAGAVDSGLLGTGAGTIGAPAMRAAFEAARELTITHTAREIAILDKDGRLRALHPDGEKYKDASGAEVKAQWDKDRLVVRTARESGPAFTETWRMAGDPAQIVVELRFQPPGGEDVTLKRVYDRAPAAR